MRGRIGEERRRSGGREVQRIWSKDRDTTYKKRDKEDEKKNSKRKNKYKSKFKSKNKSESENKR